MDSEIYLSGWLQPGRLSETYDNRKGGLMGHRYGDFALTLCVDSSEWEVRFSGHTVRGSLLR